MLRPLSENPMQQKDDVLVDIKVTTRACQSVIIGLQNGYLQVRLQAIATKGQANTCLIELLAKKFSLQKSQVELISGEKSRLKRILLHSYNVETLRKLL